MQVLAAICLAALSTLCYIRYRSQYHQDGKGDSNFTCFICTSPYLNSHLFLRLLFLLSELLFYTTIISSVRVVFSSCSSQFSCSASTTYADTSGKFHFQKNSEFSILRIHKPNKAERLKSSYGPHMPRPRPRSLLVRWTANKLFIL